MRRWLFGAVMLSISVAADATEWINPPPADPSPITDHAAFSAIWLFGKVSTSTQVNPSASTLGTLVNVEDVLGVTDKASQFRAELQLRLEERNRLRFDFLDLRRGGDTNVGETIVFGPETFNPGEEVKSELNYQQFDLAYTYSLLRGRWYELGAGLGLQLLQAEASGEVPNTGKFVKFSATEPFGEPLLDGTILIAKHWSFNARAQYLHLVVGSDSGLYENYHADVQYRYHGALALGVGYEWQEAAVNLPHSNPAGAIKLKVSGPEVFLRASF